MLTSWIVTLGQLGVVIAVIAAAIYIRNHYDDVETHWHNVAMPGTAFALLHLALFWIWPNFWSQWFETRGFILLQVVAVAGFYTISLKGKAAVSIGWALVIVSGIGLSLNARNAYVERHPAPPGDAGVSASAQTNTKTTEVADAPVAPAWSKVVQTPGPFKFDPGVNEVIAVRKSNGEIVHGVKRGQGGEIGNTTTLEFQSEGVTPAIVAVEK